MSILSIKQISAVYASILHAVSRMQNLLPPYVVFLSLANLATGLENPASGLCS
jgi:hypothetical protein